MASPKKASGLIGKITGSFRKKKADDKPKAPAADQVAADAAKAAPKAEKKAWPANRLNVIEQLWGEGYTTPGGAVRVKQFAPLLELDEKKSLLLLGAGLGGISETLIEDTGVWITGLEPDPELAKMGHESMARAGHKRKAPIRHSDLEALQLKPKSFDAMLALDGIQYVQDKKALFESVTASLRLNAEMLFVTFVLPDTNPPSKKVEIWAKHQSLPVHLWPAQAMMGMLGQMDLEVRPPDDVTRDFRNCVLKAWVNFLSTMDRKELLSKAADVVGECERWADMITAIDAGELKILKFNCIRIAERRKSVEELMAQA
ncbi:methyltransferase [Magnetovibrio sp. PR-2]|uniref:class I SAM-dependent methyltransferase n=1 Tax=Magnetovibrio sp. PR-2 TaxID=3120356 RepID=UPI002FCE0C95